MSSPERCPSPAGSWRITRTTCPGPRRWWSSCEPSWRSELGVLPLSLTLPRKGGGESCDDASPLHGGGERSAEREPGEGAFQTRLLKLGFLGLVVVLLAACAPAARTDGASAVQQPAAPRFN